MSNVSAEKVPAPAVILDLIERFHRNLDAYKSGHYNETQVRREFLDPFFEGLGWDVHNKKGWAEAYKDVIHEDAIRIDDISTAPDYAFRIGGVRKFFVEAKKPSVNLKHDISGPACGSGSFHWSGGISEKAIQSKGLWHCNDKGGHGCLARKRSLARRIRLNWRDSIRRRSSRTV